MRHATRSKITSLAVLPLLNLSGREEEEYLDSEEEKVDDISHDYEVSPIEDEPEYIGMKEE